MESIRNKAEELNSEFISHIKLSFRRQENLVKEIVTSAHKNPKMEVFKKEGKSQSRVKALSALTSVPRDELIKVVDGNKQMSGRKAAFLQKSGKKKDQAIARQRSFFKLENFGFSLLFGWCSFFGILFMMFLSF